MEKAEVVKDLDEKPLLYVPYKVVPFRGRRPASKGAALALGREGRASDNLQEMIEVAKEIGFFLAHWEFGKNSHYHLVAGDIFNASHIYHSCLPIQSQYILYSLWPKESKYVMGSINVVTSSFVASSAFIYNSKAIFLSYDVGSSTFTHLSGAVEGCVECIATFGRKGMRKAIGNVAVGERYSQLKEKLIAEMAELWVGGKLTPFPFLGKPNQ